MCPRLGFGMLKQGFYDHVGYGWVYEDKIHTISPILGVVFDSDFPCLEVSGGVVST